MASIELLAGVAIIVAALAVGWAARASATGPVRRFAGIPAIEPYFIIFVMGAVLTGGVLIALAAGAG